MESFQQLREVGWCTGGCQREGEAAGVRVQLPDQAFPHAARLVEHLAAQIQVHDRVGLGPIPVGFDRQSREQRVLALEQRM